MKLKIPLNGDFIHCYPQDEMFSVVAFVDLAGLGKMLFDNGISTTQYQIGNRFYLVPKSPEDFNMLIMHYGEACDQ